MLDTSSLLLGSGGSLLGLRGSGILSGFRCLGGGSLLCGTGGLDLGSSSGGLGLLSCTNLSVIISLGSFLDVLFGLLGGLILGFLDLLVGFILLGGGLFLGLLLVVSALLLFLSDLIFSLLLLSGLILVFLGILRGFLRSSGFGLVGLASGSAS